MKTKIYYLILLGIGVTSVHAQNVGIGVPAPLYKLDVAGSINATGAVYAASAVGIGTTTPSYKLQVVDGSVAIYNTTDSKFWSMSYSSGINGLSFYENGTSARLTLLNGGNIGIGLTSPAYKLDVSGAIRASGNIQTLGDLSVSGNANIEGGGGVAYNPKNGNSMKVVPFTTANFHAVLGAHGSAETTIGLPSGFTSTPYVYVGAISVTGGTSGELNRVILQLWGCSSTSCNAKIINTDNAAVDYNITWNVLAIGY